jgi:hypothetical protein
MPVRVYLCGDHCLRVNTFFGAVTPAHFKKLAAFYAVRRDLLTHDLINLVDEEVEVTDFTAEALGELRALYRDLQINADFMVQRRSAWICPSITAWPILESWLEGRHVHDGQGTEFCLVARLEDAGILFDAHEIEAVRNWSTFHEIACVDA